MHDINADLLIPLHFYFYFSPYFFLRSFFFLPSSWINRFESILTVEETADWVRYAVQLPEEVAETFRSNSISGYDFVDLLNYDGQGLLFDLGLKRSDQKRIIKVADADALSPRSTRLLFEPLFGDISKTFFLSERRLSTYNVSFSAEGAKAVQIFVLGGNMSFRDKNIL